MKKHAPRHFRVMTPMPLPVIRPSRVDPLAFPELASLETVRQLLSRGGLPPQSYRSPTDEARIAAFFTLQELLHILNEFRRAHQTGAPCRLAVSENGRSPGRITIEIAIVPAAQNDVAA